MRYDEEDNQVEQESPEGSATATADDHSTRTVYDEVGQRVAEIRHSRGAEEPSQDFATSWAFEGAATSSG